MDVFTIITTNQETCQINMCQAWEFTIAYDNE